MTTKPSFVDLHTHTFYSDGQCTPEDVIKTAKWNGLSILAIADHDSIRGYEEARPIAENYGIWLTPGVELTTRDYHILAYGPGILYGDIKNLIERSRDLQNKGAAMRIERLQEAGVPITLEKVVRDHPLSRLGQINIMDSILRDFECRQWIFYNHRDMTPFEIFKIYLGKGSIASNFERPSISPQEIIETIRKNDDALTILAHPPKDVKSIEEVDRLVDLGLDGIEIQPNFYNDEYKKYEEYAKKKNLFVTFGSDFHGPRFANTPLLKAGGMNKVRECEYCDDTFESWLSGFGPPIRWDAELREAYADSWGG